MRKTSRKTETARKAGMAKKKTFREVLREYLGKGVKLERYQKIGVFLLVVVIAGFVGWVYEFLVALVETGQIYMKGGNLLPWINIYAIGAIVVVPVTYKVRKNPWAVGALAALMTGLVELVGGWLVYVVGNGTRYWNYDHGLWGVGSINGFVCPLSVLFFTIGSLALVYLVVPVCIYLAQRMSKRGFLVLAITLFVLVMADEVVNLTLKNLDKPTAVDFYRSLGFEYEKF